MSMIGNQTAANYRVITKDRFSGDNSNTTFTLSKATTTNGVAVFVNNVRQEPGVAYNITNNTTLDFGGSPPSSGTNNIYVLHHNSPASVVSLDTSAITTASLTSTGAISGTTGTFSGAFTSPGIDDNGDATTITIDANEDITAANGMYVSGDLTSLTVDKGGIDRSGNTTRIISGRAGGNYADFSVNIAGVGGVNRQLYMDYQGNMTLDNGNLVIGTAGKGISFAADANAPDMTNELLDDYEEGEISLVMGGHSNIGTAAANIQANENYSGGQGKYVKVGNLCYIQAYFFSQSTTTQASGELIIQGLPFACAGNGGAFTTQSYNLGLPASGDEVTVWGAAGSTQLNGIYNRSQATWTATNANVMPNNTAIYVRISGTYRTQ